MLQNKLNLRKWKKKQFGKQQFYSWCQNDFNNYFRMSKGPDVLVLKEMSVNFYRNSIYEYVAHHKNKLI